ncbi:MAG: hypothetical protein JEZ06_07440 [Anaerolineaceae bacterium]|nr:hypothetical protein [Anaerolineaceae bacterium]
MFFNSHLLGVYTGALNRKNIEQKTFEQISPPIKMIKNGIGKKDIIEDAAFYMDLEGIECVEILK